jgi:PAS domain S-box-containing protein
VSPDPLEPIDGTFLWEAAPDGMLLVDPAGTIRAANSEAHRLFGYGKGELVGRRVDDLVPTEIARHHAALRESFHEAPRRRGMGTSQRLVGLRANGESTPVHISLSPLAEGLTIAAVRDMTEHLAFEKRLVESTRRRLLAEDHERIARDLHDTVIQELFALGMTLQATVSQMPDNELGERIGRSVETLDDVIRSIRALIFDVNHEPNDDASSLRTEVVDIAASLTPSLGFEPSVSFHGPVETAVPAEVHDHLRAVVREGLANVARHADATAATVAVTVADDHVSVRVSDDGVGIPETLQRRSGLANLADRAIQLGGRCEWAGHPDGGTSLRWTAPLRPVSA